MVGSRLAQKVAIVTGGAAASPGAGMGRAIAERFGQEGASVVVVDVAPGGQTTAERINAAGGDAIFVRADVLQRGEVENVVKTTIDRFARIDILVNVVGGSAREHGFLDVSDEMFDQILDRNLKSVYLCCQVAIPRMIESGGGSIVHISSTNALLGCPGLVVYSAVKSGFFGFSRNIATEFGGRGIRSNVICPGLMGDGRPDPRQPLGRTCVAADIANATLFLASDEASFVSGQVIAVDGGHTTSYPEIF